MLEGIEAAWKWDARCHVWSYMQAKGFSLPPHPLHHRVPNFHGVRATARALSRLGLFQEARSVAVSPENAQLVIRELVLEQDKTLYVPHPQLKEAHVFTQIHRRDVANVKLKTAVTSTNVHHLGTPMSLKDPFKVRAVTSQEHATIGV